MRHRGVPTRLVDRTASPFVALYLAAAGPCDRDGGLWCYAQSGLEARWSSSLKSRCLIVQPVEMPAEDCRNIRAVGGTPVIRDYICGVQTERMAAQPGVFTVCTDVFRDHAELLEVLLNRRGGLRRVVFSGSIKRPILKNLHRMNIAGASLFPGIDGVGRYLFERALVKCAG